MSENNKRQRLDEEGTRISIEQLERMLARMRRDEAASVGSPALQPAVPRTTGTTPVLPIPITTPPATTAGEVILLQTIVHALQSTSTAVMDATPLQPNTQAGTSAAVNNMPVIAPPTVSTTPEVNAGNIYLQINTALP